MNTNGSMRSWEYLDDPWHRLTWILPTSVLLWTGLLIVFAALIKRIPPTPPALAPADVRFVELPPAVAPAGPAAPAHHPALARPKPKVVPARPHHHYVRVHRPPVHVRRVAPARTFKPAPKPPASAMTSNPAPAASSREHAATATNETNSRKAQGTGSGIGSDSGGARAIFAPKPVIPDDLRDQTIKAVAVAHFEVARDGKVQVILTTPTDIPELNQILINTLKQWRFFPAMKNGIAINSQFNVRIPISVQ
jgi:protein TonB